MMYIPNDIPAMANKIMFSSMGVPGSVPGSPSSVSDCVVGAGGAFSAYPFMLISITNMSNRILLVKVLIFIWGNKVSL